MTRTEVEQLYDDALCLGEGSAMDVPFDTLKEMNCARVQLYRERDKYAAKMKGSPQFVEIGINATVKDGECYVTLRRAHAPKPVRIRHADGTVEIKERVVHRPNVVEQEVPFKPKEQKTVLNEHGLTADQQRMYKCMIEDGHSHEEALSFLVA